jgi:hypothetical protein
VHVAVRTASGEKSALKVHQERDSYIKEREAYYRLRQVHQIRGFHVPQILNCDDQLRIIEMTIVNKPYLLDFAGVSLDHPIEFPQDVWREWEEQKREQFGDHWPFVKKVIAELEGFGIYLNDVSPSNIAWQ